MMYDGVRLLRDVENFKRRFAKISQSQRSSVMCDPASIAKWVKIRDTSLQLHRLGENPGQILRWSEDKSVQEVHTRCQDHGMVSWVLFR